MLYQLLLNQIEPERRLYLTVGNPDCEQTLSEPIGELVIHELPLNLLVVNLETAEVQQWIPPRNIKQS